MAQLTGLHTGPLEEVVNVLAREVERASLSGSSVRLHNLGGELTAVDQRVHRMRRYAEQSRRLRDGDPLSRHDGPRMPVAASPARSSTAACRQGSERRVAVMSIEVELKTLV